MESSRYGKMRMNVGGDRLSSLPDDLIHKILAFLPIKDAIGTSVLSSRWRFIWTISISHVRNSIHCNSSPNQICYQCRNNLTEVYSLKLTFRGKVSHVFVKRILNYAFSHNVQQLNVVWLHVKDDMTFPLSLFSSKSLNSLTMQIDKRYHGISKCLTSTWELPSLTTLDLHSVTFCDDEADKCIGIFSKCANLKNLKLTKFNTMGSDAFSICHPQLSNLTLVSAFYTVKVINVVAPQLENLTIRSCEAEHVISAPHLVSFLYKGYHSLHLSTDGFHSLEKADVCVSNPREANAHQIVCFLQHLHNLKVLTLNLEIAEEIIAHQLMAEFRVNLEKEKDNIKTSNAHMERGKAPEENHKPKTIEKLEIGGNMTQLKGYWENLLVQIELKKNTACILISKLQRIEELLAALPALNRAKIQPCFSSL